MNITRKTKSVLLPKQERILAGLGENIRLARLRRSLTAVQIAERAGISRTTLYKVETGDGGVAMGAYVKVLYVLGLEGDLKQVGERDELGRNLQDARLKSGVRRTPKI